jgi:hypothetical protein
MPLAFSFLTFPCFDLSQISFKGTQTFMYSFHST